MEEKKTCACCGKENEPQNEFCSECGSVLTGKRPQPEFQQSYTPPAMNMQDNTYTEYGEGEGKISAEEMNRFVGKNANKIIPKFNRMEYSDSKASWNWTVFWLTFLFGPIGAGFWFIYRKMTKIGIIIICAAIALNLTFDFLGGNMQASADKLNNINAIVDEADSLSELLNSLSEMPPEGVVPAAGSEIVTGLSDLIDIISAIVFGIFSMYIYKQHCMKMIFRIRMKAQNEAMTYAMYNQLGGVSSGALGCAIVVGLFSYSALDSIFSALLM